MRTWYQALSQGKVLSAKSTRAMFTSQTAVNGQDILYEYSWEISQRDGLGRVVTHNGGGSTGNSILVDFRDKHLTIIMLGNRITYDLLGPSRWLFASRPMKRVTP